MSPKAGNAPARGVYVREECESLAIREVVSRGSEHSKQFFVFVFRRRVAAGCSCGGWLKYFRKLLMYFRKQLTYCRKEDA